MAQQVKIGFTMKESGILLVLVISFCDQKKRKNRAMTTTIIHPEGCCGSRSRNTTEIIGVITDGGGSCIIGVITGGGG